MPKRCARNAIICKIRNEMQQNASTKMRKITLVGGARNAITKNTIGIINKSTLRRRTRNNDNFGRLRS